MINVLSAEKAELIDAVHAWHRGEALTRRQHDLIETARIQCLARAYGVDLGPATLAVPGMREPGQGGQ